MPSGLKAGVSRAGRDAGAPRGATPRGHRDAGELADLDVDSEHALGFGDPAEELARLVEKHRPDLIVLGSHGHRAVGDIVHGTSVERLRHRVRIPVMVIPAE